MKLKSGLLLVTATMLANTTTAMAANSNSPNIDKVLAELNRQHSNASNLAKLGRNSNNSLALSSPLMSSSNASTSNGNTLNRLTSVASNTVSQFSQSGTASWSGKQLQGQKTANGEKFNMYAMTASHPSLPMNSYVQVTNKANGKTVVVKINDRRATGGRILDLSYGAAQKLGMDSGASKVTIKRIAL